MTNIYDSFLSLEDMRIRIRFLFEWSRGTKWCVERMQNPCTTVWLITNGERDLLLDEQTYRIRGGDLIIIPPYTRISLSLLEESPVPFQYLSLGCEWKMGVFDFVDYYQFPRLTHLDKEQLQSLIDVWKALRQSWDEFVEAVSFEHAATSSIYKKGILAPSRIEIPTNQGGRFFEIKGLLFQWLAAVFHLLQSQLPTGPKLLDDRVQKVCHYIGNHYAEKLSLKDLSEIVFLSESQLRVLFKKTLNVSPMNYMHQVRLQKAKEMLMVTDEPIGTIASAVGFDELSYFCRMFRKKEKVSPAKYRRTITDFHV
jgi:AraC-like DNA-binding protein